MAQHTIKIDKAGTASRAMLLSVTIHHWKGRSSDKRVSDEVAEAYDADADMGAYFKRLVVKERLAKINKVTGKIRDLWYARTLPWLDQGTRILPNGSYFETLADLKALVHEREDAVIELVHNWEEVVAEAKVRLNGLFREADYPTAQQLRHAFRVKITPIPFPSGTDFRLGAIGPDPEADAALRAEFNEQLNEALGEAMREVWQRVHDVTKKMAENLAAYDPKELGHGTKFHGSMIEHTRDLVKLLPGLNVTADPILAGLTDRMEKQLCAHDADELRADGKLRQQTAQAAQKILDQVSEFLA
jgi:hypothetical protein